VTHFPVVVFTEAGSSGEVEHLLAPFDEQEEAFREGSRWDWWVVGGRWDGALLGTEPKIVKVRCDTCDGTGTRDDGLERFGADWVASMNGCNGCHGKGYREEGAAQYGQDPDAGSRNAGSPSTFAADFVPTAFVVPGAIQTDDERVVVAPDGRSTWVEEAQTGWFATTMNERDPAFAQKWAEAKGALADAVGVLVDCHV